MTELELPPPAWRNRIIGYEEVTPEQLEANPANPKIHDQTQQDAMTALLDDVGFVVPIIVNKPTMRIVDGHMRVGLVAARGAGMIPVAYVDLTPEEEQEILALLDPIGRLAGYDGDALAAVLAGLSTTVDLDQLLANLGQATVNAPPVMNTDPDVIPDWPAPVTERGDIWLLGPHRVMCGDSTSVADLDALMGGHEAQSMVTDPPYGVSYGDTVAWRRSMGKSQRPQADSDVHNDGDLDAAKLWADCFPLWIAKLRKKGSAVYCWGAGGQQQIDMGMALRDAGCEIHGSVIWVKSSFSFSRADHKYQHEPCWYGWRADGTHEWCGPNNETSVWEYPKPSSSPDHPTQKPIELIRRCIRNVTSPGGLTVDPFLGSGTAVLAAHLEGRVCYGMELTPRYVDIVCKRYQLATGTLPVNAATGDQVDFNTEEAPDAA